MSKVLVGRSNRRTALAGGLVALLVGATLGSAPAALAANQNEVVMRLNYDGTALAADSGFADATPDTYTELDTGAHTPGLDDSVHNRVVRTYDQYGYVIDYDVNEAAGKDIMLTVELTTGTGAPLTDPTSANPNPNSNVRWLQDANMAAKGWFTGCLPNTTNDPNGTRIQGATLYCKLGDLPEGTHGTIRPIVALRNGVDTTQIGAKVTMTSSTSVQNPAPYSVPRNVYVSAAVNGNWIKNTPTVVQTTSGGVPGYIALFPIGLADPAQSNTPVPGSARIPAPTAGASIDFFDHFYQIAGITATAANGNVRLATQAEMDATHSASIPQQRVWGTPCGAYNATNAGPLPGNLPGAWTCNPTVSYTNNYPVVSLGVSNYSNTRVATNADGTPNGQAYVITGQVAFWISKPAMDAVNGTTTTAKFANAISNVGAADNFKVATTTIKPIEVVPTTMSPYGGTPELDLTPPLAADAPAAAAAKSRADNRSPFSIVPPTSGTGGSTGGVSFTSHFGLISNSYGLQQNIAVNDSGVKWDPANPTVYVEPFYNQLPQQNQLWDGRGTVARGQQVSLQMQVGAYSDENKSSQLHGCMVWDGEQLQVTKMPDFSVRYLRDSYYVEQGRGTRAPTFPMANLSVGSANMGTMTAGPGHLNRIVEMTPAQMAQYGLKLQFAYDSTVMHNAQTAPTVPNPASSFDNKSTGAVAINGVECNGNTAAGTRSAWIDASSLAFDSVDSAYKINGNAVNMARVIMTGTKPFPWYNFTNTPNINGGSIIGMTSGMYLSIQAHVGTDLLKNYEGKSVYIHTSRGSGQWNTTTNSPAGTPGSPASCNNTPLSVYGKNRDAYPPGADGPGLPPTTTGWCNLAYDPTSAGEDGSINFGGRTLDAKSFTFYYFDASDMSPGHDGVHSAMDGDTDRIKIVGVRPQLQKTNVNGVFNIADNGDLVTYKLDVSAIGSGQEALRNVTLADPIISRYELVSFTQPSTPGSYCDRRTINGTPNVYCRFSSSTHDGPGTDTAPTGLLPGDAAPVGGTLPRGLPGSTWKDSITITVRVRGAVATPNANTVLTNTATISSVGFGAWNSATGTYQTNATINTTTQQTKVSQASSYLPFPADKGAVVKSVDKSFGDCVADANGNVLSGDALATWQSRCALIGLDPTASGAVTDGEGNGEFTLSYRNLGNTNLQGLRIVDVLPYVGDGTAGAPEAGSGTGLDVTPGQQTVGDKRSPATAIAGRVGLLSVTLPPKRADTGSTTYSGGSYWVTSAASGSISRDPDVSYNPAGGCRRVKSHGARPSVGPQWQARRVRARQIRGR